MNKPHETEKIVFNQYIKNKEVRVIDSDGEQLGVMRTDEALNKAYSQELDLVIITFQSSPPVARIVDVNKYNYEQKKRQKDADKKARQNSVEIKEVKLRPGIGEHDLEIKTKQISKFLEKGAKVKVTIQLRGREITKGNDVISHMSDEISNRVENYKFEQEFKQAGNRIIGVITKDG